MNRNYSLLDFWWEERNEDLYETFDVVGPSAAQETPIPSGFRLPVHGNGHSHDGRPPF